MVIALDPAQLALLHALDAGAFALPAQGPLRFLGAVPGPLLLRLASARTVCEQGFRPDADVVARTHALADGDAPPDGSAQAVLVLPPRQREAARALLARALAWSAPGGLVVAAQGNDAGGGTLARDLAALAPLAGTLGKHHSRVAWLQRDEATLDRDLLARWQAAAAVQPILDGDWWSRPGLFAWDRIDAGSALLAAQLPDDLRGHVADLGGGFGFLSCTLLARCRGIASLDLFEADARALPAARRNLEQRLCARVLASGDAAGADVDLVLPRDGADVPLALRWHDVTAGLPGRYDAIVSNPPFHTTRADRPDLGQAFINAAADALHADGQLWLVANRHLPYEATLARRFAQVRAVADRNGFKVLHAQGPRAS